MTERAPYRSGGRADQATSGWAVGLILFAAVMMLMTGVFQALAGLIAIFENDFYVATRNYLFRFDVTAWGWIHLIVGTVVALAGWGLLAGADLGQSRRDHPGRAERDRQLPVHPLLPVLVAADHRPGRVRDLGDRRPRPGGRGLTGCATSATR